MSDVNFFDFLDGICDSFIKNKVVCKEGLYKTGANLILTEEFYDYILHSINISSGFPEKLLYRGFIFSFTKANQNEVQTPA